LEKETVMKKPRYTPEMIFDLRDPNKNVGLTAVQLAVKHDISPMEVGTIRNLPDEVFKTEAEYLASKAGQ
jgi:hypothetical protein